jgi:hypothetical protein
MRDLTFLQAQGGWKSVELVMRYVHAGTDDLAESVLAHGWTIRGERATNRLGANSAPSAAET